MAFVPHKLATSRPRCHLAMTLAQIVEQSILSRLNETTTAENFQALQQTLILLCMELEQQADWRHYAGTDTLRHCCVRDIYTQAAFILKHLSLTQPAPPAPQPPEPPPPDPQEHSLEDIVENIESAEDTFLGDTVEGENKD